ncbi:MAG: CocE/NonD family hydrolase [Bacteroidales bacterium]|nr:CocE/NonD family hydrolase [Bacteroidales bacterium]
MELITAGKMKKFVSMCSGLLLLLLFPESSICMGQEAVVTPYIDGIYEGRSRGYYTEEPYWGITRIKIENGKFTEVHFVIRDSSLHEPFDGQYEKHFAGNPVYINQSRSDWAGVQAYPKKLREKQDTNKLDAISGATWSYNIFRATVSEALKKGTARPGKITTYIKKSYMVPMRDGIKLFTVVLTPKDCSSKVPVLIQRTPYGSDIDLNGDSTMDAESMGSLRSMAEEGYIFVFQDIRGKFRSEGKMQIHLPIVHMTRAGITDESTDTWDAVDWLIKNIPGNNGRAGIYGISYPGWLALVGSIDPHPALKASSEQACMGDLFLGDDFHHNGAFRLSYGLEYTYQVESEKRSIHFPFPQFDLFSWYLKLGSLKNVNEKYFKDKIPTWNNFAAHPDYDEFWQKDSPLSYVSGPEVPMLHVGGYFDQEDINGPQLMYRHMEKRDSANRNFIVLGPWNHGQWGSADASGLGRIEFGSNTAEWFHDLQKRWFDYWLKGEGVSKFSEAYCFQTGTNQWKTYDSWPPKEAEIRKFYAKSDNTADFTGPVGIKGSVSYISDPFKPVPYRTLPIEATYSYGSRWDSWHVEDQRFVTTRPDVISFVGDTLKENLTVTGAVMAHIFAGTSASDLDLIVKLIDVYPCFDSNEKLMSQYELPVAMEVFRGRFRKSFKTPEPMIPGKPEEFVIDLHQVNHTFLQGHRLMIQIQSTWFPIIDRNPQKYVPNIFEAKDDDFTKATHTIYCNSQYSTYIELPVMKE